MTRKSEAVLLTPLFNLSVVGDGFKTRYIASLSPQPDNLLRLDAVAKNIVHHFLNRGYQGKAMVVSIDKLTTLRMYEKVRAEWEAEKGSGLRGGCGGRG